MPSSTTVKELYASGLSGIEDEFARYMDAVILLERVVFSREQLAKEKASLYASIADVNREIRTERQNIALCDEISGNAPHMEKDIESTKEQIREVRKDERRRR
jgi:hypothetical protein